MAPESNLAAQPGELELVITRIFDAPRGLVFKAWTAPEHLVQWWGPRGFTLPSCEIDPRPGGAYRFHMRGPEGDDHWSRGLFREFVEPERLAMTFAWVDAQSKPIGPETLLTVTFDDHGGKTKLTLRQTGFESVTSCESHRSGWTSSFECLADYVASI